MDHHHKQTIVEQITDVLADRIIRGELQPDEKLRQDHIAEEFGASHVPVREAFRHLEARGLAQSIPRRGVRVSTFDVSEAKEVAEIRAVLEVLALRNAFPHLSPEIFVRAQQAIDDGENAQDIYSWEEANQRFHRTIVSCCKMPKLLATLDDLHIASARFLFASWKSKWETRIEHDHRTIIKALRGGDLENAAKVLERHVRLTGRKLSTFL